MRALKSSLAQDTENKIIKKIKLKATVVTQNTACIRGNVGMIRSSNSLIVLHTSAWGHDLNSCAHTLSLLWEVLQRQKYLNAFP